MSEARAIAIDCDPGHDDAVALLLALAAPERLDIRAVTTVAGNVPLDRTERNARAIVELARRDDVAVYAGCERPWRRALVTAEHIVGATGLDGADLPPPTRPLAQGHAVDALAELLRQAPARSVTLCPLGPLTNIGALFSRGPELVARVREIVLMGGAIGIGNVTASAEFNIFADPHAASSVFAAGAPIVMVPLEATHQAIATPQRVRAFERLGTPVGRAIAGMLGRDSGRDLTRYGGSGVPLHDPCVIGYLLWPELFAGFAAHVAIETESELTMGRTIVDRWRSARPADNATVIDRVDAETLFSRMTATLARL
ncbi:MAG TPA: nucleoside hydrolase [Alphaproteobacteria bacterium]|nr:nucleoside hydrolase [Alphaproteobacteria bacterium]